jgi:thiol-disulfide isomerase/thioredoxin
MKYRFLPGALLTASLILITSGGARAQSAVDFLKETMTRYQALKTFQAECGWNTVYDGKPDDPSSQSGETRMIAYQTPNIFKIVSTHANSYVQTSVSDGTHLCEYGNNGDDTMTSKAPPSIARADSMQMEHPMFCGTLLYQFFGGPDNIDRLVKPGKGLVSFGPDITIDGESCKTVKFYGTGTYGHVEAAISPNDYLVRRISYDDAPIMAQMKTQMETQMKNMLEDPEVKKKLKKHPEIKKQLLANFTMPATSLTTEVYSKIVVDQPIAASVFDITPQKDVQTSQESDFAREQAEMRKPPVAIGTTAPDFTVKPLAGGKMVKLSDKRGNIVLLDFWATWCPPCRESLPETQKIAKKYNGHGLTVMTIDDEDAATISGFLKKNHYSFPVYRDVTQSASKAFKVTGIPTIAVIDKDGKLAAFMVGLQEPSDVMAALKKAGLQTQ